MICKYLNREQCGKKNYKKKIRRGTSEWLIWNNYEKTQLNETEENWVKVKRKKKTFMCWTQRNYNHTISMKIQNLE